MHITGDRKLVIIWLALVGLTLVSWWAGANKGNTGLHPNAAITFGVLLMAAIKVRLVIRHFMEVHNAPALLRRLTDAWIALLMLALFGLYSFHAGISL